VIKFKIISQHPVENEKTINIAFRISITTAKIRRVYPELQGFWTLSIVRYCENYKHNVPETEPVSIFM
jgi:hypothetical protein